MVDAGKPKSGIEEAKPPKIKAEDNPWYLLATLYGVPENGNDALRKKNRVAWNRYFSATLDEEARTRLFEAKRHSAEELTPFSPEGLTEVAAAFAQRRDSTRCNALPPPDSMIDFSNVQFDRDIDFDKYLFSASSFLDATFAGRPMFNSATFSREARFNGATFSRGASIGGATFSDQTYFDGAAFSSLAHFDGAAFSGRAFFQYATFSGGAKFRGTKFHASSSFVNAKLKTITSFTVASFKAEPPEFFGAELHEGTVWPSREAWPIPKTAKKAEDFIHAYECLKREMDERKKHEDELDFFALELQSRRVLLGPWRGWQICLYGVLSDYGRSYLRPLVALFCSALIGTLFFLRSDSLSPGQSLGLSVANTLNVFGFRKDFFDSTTIEGLPAILKILAAVQTILGTILLFLFGLGIRNKFRMK